MEMFDQSGNYISTNMQRKIETAFFREDFLRIDSDDLGIIEFAESAIDRYKKDFFDKLRLQKPARNLKVVVDYGYFGVSSLLPPMLSRLGIESIAVNAFDDPKRAPRDKDNVESHLQQLQKLTQTVDYDFGVLFLDDGERLEVVDDQGQVVPSMELSSILGTLIAASKEGAKIAMPVTASSALEQHLIKMNAQVLRTKSGTSALTTAALSESCDLAADGTGGYSFPWFHQGFDAIFTFAKLAQLLQGSGAKLSEIRKTLPQFFVAHEVVPCTWEAKGTVMRLLTEDTAGQSVDQTDGIKIFTESHWVLVLPDPVEPVFHLYSEAEDNREASEKLSHFKERIQQIQIQFA
jgi:mannose-1-phosphate guanylyltransferase/phosphomannomutase